MWLVTNCTSPTACRAPPSNATESDASELMAGPGIPGPGCQMSQTGSSGGQEGELWRLQLSPSPLPCHGWRYQDSYECEVVI